MGSAARVWLIAVTIVGAFAAPGPSGRAAPVYYVNGSTGDDASDGLSWATAKETVRAAISALSGGHEVWVAAGIYYERIMIPADTYVYGGFVGNETSREQRDWHANVTVLDGQDQGVVVTLCYWLSLKAIDGFTIQHGTDGVDCFMSASGSIANSRICYNSGYGISGQKNHGSITNNVICHNGKGGICCDADSPSITNNTIVDNGGEGIIMWAYSSWPYVSNNIIAFNGTGMRSTGSGPREPHNNCVYNPGGENYVGFEPPASDISVDPRFLNRASGNYRLPVTSPCVNAGWNEAVALPSCDLDLNSRTLGGVADIGAYECARAAVTLPEAKLTADGMPVSLGLTTVSAAFNGFFYLESENRCCGIRVDRPQNGLSTGARARVIGTLATTPDGERTILAHTVTSYSTGTCAPLGLSIRSLIGGDWNYSSYTGRGQMGLAGGSGLNTVGLLVRICGRVLETDTSAPPQWLMLIDGSACVIKAILPDGVTTPEAGAYVAVTGISSCEKVGVNLLPILRVRTQDDIREF